MSALAWWFFERLIGCLLVLIMGAWALVSANGQIIAAVLRMAFEVWVEPARRKD